MTERDPVLDAKIKGAVDEIQAILEREGLVMTPTISVGPAPVIEKAPPTPIIKPGDDILMSTEMYEGPGDPIGSGKKEEGGILG